MSGNELRVIYDAIDRAAERFAAIAGDCAEFSGSIATRAVYMDSDTVGDDTIAPEFQAAFQNIMDAYDKSGQKSSSLAETCMNLSNAMRQLSAAFQKLDSGQAIGHTEQG